MKRKLHPNTLNLIWFCVMFVLVITICAILDHFGIIIIS
jgi:hypothetical protein